ncbi:tRNA (guanosine(37)-N1)-methyltransferase TrmD [Sulfobacillus sp. hq2]|uniref:tRNA (guanosine(37)-N1)-methyltransferase TrmD n=1 Tax=Sulfobacillus TaxID=28033 RepID=UPI000CD144A9|nr:tRNA (guanosine(37)-N1)-methyltransferase TrmD [Sulfobacillus sp. hq2]POB09163.1 tRNA (guanosine(37)-N1)-methyltransferase TrmD [Sulfobacillus sp. hq2]
MVIQVVTLFPEMFEGPMTTSIVRRAQDRGLVDIRRVPLRWFGVGPHRVTDDYPFGGNIGMLLRADVVVPAVEWATVHHAAAPTVLVTSAQGRRFDQTMARELAQLEHLIVVAGHYEGIDERAIHMVHGQEVSIGDVVLTGGEIPAMVMIDAIVRLLPGALGADEGAWQESFSGAGGLEGPQYTRPRVFRDQAVPDVLLSGDHAKIAKWQSEQARRRTAERRPDLL